MKYHILPPHAGRKTYRNTAARKEIRLTLGAEVV